jgi:two-component system LytT family response regulator
VSIVISHLRAVIADDEQPARELLRSLLEAWPTIVIVGESADGQSAVRLIERERPDIVFLDVQMPVLNGFDVVAEVTPAQMPLVIFVTAYDRYALRAFEVSACDYLLKPFDEDRLAIAVRRAFERLADPRRLLAPALESLLAAARSTAPGAVAVKVDGSHLLLDAEEIEWIEAAGKMLHLHLAKRVLSVRESMSSIEMRLDPRLYLRVHRSAIVNRSHVREIQPWFKGDYVLILRSGTRIQTGRAYAHGVRSLIGGR